MDSGIASWVGHKSCSNSLRKWQTLRPYCGGAGLCTIDKGGSTDDALTLALVKAGENPLDSIKGLGASDLRSMRANHTVGSLWFSSTVIHYTGHGLWTIGFAPHPRSKDARWQWIHELDNEAATALLGESRNRIVRCDTKEVRQILRDCP